jgi:hypothetical protein
MLIRLGFHQIFIDLLMKCVRSVKYKIKVNNELTANIIPERQMLLMYTNCRISWMKADVANVSGSPKCYTPSL